jgi:FAD:protein FMN transferase
MGIDMRRGNINMHLPFLCFFFIPRRSPSIVISFVGLLFSIFLLLSSCSSRPAKPVTESEFYLGTLCSVTLYDRVPKGIFKEVFAKVQDIEEKMSVNREDSEISRVNKNAGKKPVSLSEESFFVISRALEIAEISGGAFDPTVGPLVELWGIGTEGERIPEKEEIQELLPLVHFRNVVLDRENREVFLKREGMKLDLGGIAKGYAADSAAAILREKGVKEAIIDFGGNILVLGKKGGKTPWRVGIQDPRNQRGRFLGIVHLTDSAVVTSGNYERYFTSNGKRYHHILDTHTGYPIWNNLDSATIVTKNSTDADALSTAVYAMGLKRGLDLIRGLSYGEGIIVTKGKEVYRSSGMAEAFVLSSFSEEGYRIIKETP